MTPEAQFEAIADQLLREPGVEEGTGFGSSAGLRVDGRIFAMRAPAGLIVKLPAGRCAELVAVGTGRPFDRGQGRPLKEWIVVACDATAEWSVLAREALDYVRPK